MRKYRNTKTGVIVCVDSEVKGDWVEITLSPVSEAKTEEKPKRAKRTPKKK